MVDIFKWFFGIVGILILTYILVVSSKAIFSGATDFVSGISTSAQNTISSTSSSASSSSIMNWIKNLHPLTVAPINIVPAATQNIYEGVNSEYKNTWTYANGDDANSNSDFDTRWGGGGYFASTIAGRGANSNSNPYSLFGFNQNSQININLSKESFVKNYQTIYGLAGSDTFEDKYFFIYVLDNNKKVIGSGKMFMNGDPRQNGKIPFRGVLSYSNPNTQTGSLVTSTGENILNINFYEYRSTIITKMPSIIFPSKTAR